MTAFAIAAGGAVGALLRYMVATRAVLWLGAAFPYGTLLVNVAGSLLMGVVMEVALQKFPEAPMFRAFFATGVLGGFTTFSAFSYDVFQLAARDEYIAAGGYMMASVMGAVVALVAGIYLARAVV